MQKTTSRVSAVRSVGISSLSRVIQERPRKVMGLITRRALVRELQGYIHRSYTFNGENDFLDLLRRVRKVEASFSRLLSHLGLEEVNTPPSETVLRKTTKKKPTVKR